MNLEIQRGKSISRFVEACRDGNLKLAIQVYTSPRTIQSDILLSSHCPLTGLTGLHAAAEFDRIRIVKWYVRNNADLNLPCANLAKATPLHYAARAGRHNTISYLLKNELKLADKHPLDAKGLEPIGMLYRSVFICFLFRANISLTFLLIFLSATFFF